MDPFNKLCSITLLISPVSISFDLGVFRQKVSTLSINCKDIRIDLSLVKLQISFIEVTKLGKKNACY